MNPRHHRVRGIGRARSGLAVLAAASVFAAAASSAHAEGGALVAWGNNYQYQLGAGFKSRDQAAPVAVRGLSNVTAVAPGFHFSMALLADGTVRAWGDNPEGQLGDGSRTRRDLPVPVVGLTEVKSISVANEHALALLKNGTVLTWGAAEYGERGNGESGFEREAKERNPNLPNRDLPAVVPNLEHVAAISSGGASDFAMLENGTVVAWGENRFGMLGLGQGGPEECKGEIGVLPCSTVPRPVLLPEGARAIALDAGRESVYALLSTGEVLAWGNSGHGQLGNGSTEPTSVPGKVDVPKLEEELKAKLEVAAVSGGNLFALALLKTGEVIGWGANGMGQLGGKSADECIKVPHSCSTTPKLVGGLTQISAIAGGGGFSLVLKNGTIYAFGVNEKWGQLGIGSAITNTNVPTEIRGLEPVTAIAAGEQHSLAILQGGSGPPPPEFSVKPEAGALNVSWTINAGEFHLRWRTPPKTGHWTPIVKLRGPCSAEKACGYVIGGLAKVPYEVQLITFTGGVREQIKLAEATPE